MAASFENAWDHENVVGFQPLNRLHLGEHGEGVMVEAAASAGSDEGDPAADICLGNFVEQFSRKGELATARVQCHEAGSDDVETREVVGG